MAWKSVNTNATDIKKFPKKPYIGEYKGSQEITTKIGQQVIWNFTEDSGVPLGIYGFTNLNRVMEHIELGSICRITYLGTEKVQTKFGLKDVHQVKVEIDEPDPKDSSGVDAIAKEILSPDEIAGNVKDNDDLPF